jgi:hypothetical protein
LPSVLPSSPFFICLVLETTQGHTSMRERPLWTGATSLIFDFGSPLYNVRHMAGTQLKFALFKMFITLLKYYLSHLKNMNQSTY